MFKRAFIITGILWGLFGTAAAVQADQTLPSVSSASCVSSSSWTYTIVPSSSSMPAKHWKDAPDISILNTTGNTRTESLSLKNLWVYDLDPYKLGIAFGGYGARNAVGPTAENYFANEKLDWKYDPRDYLYEKVAWNKDRFAGIRSRYEGTAGAGRHFWKEEDNTLDAELGVGYTDEHRTDDSYDKFPMIRGFAKYGHRLNVSNLFTQTVEWLTNVNDGSDFRMNTETALTSSLTGHLALKTSYTWAHVNRPPVGSVADDTITAVSLIGYF